MEKKIEKAIWLSFDLGIGGDYPGLYKWLDNHDAIECGDSVAFFKLPVTFSKANQIDTIVKREIEASVRLRAGDRIYMVWRETADSTCAVKGDFIFGKRKGNPWEGYGDSKSSGGESGE